MTEATPLFHERQTYSRWVIVLVLFSMFAPLTVAGFLQPHGVPWGVLIVMPAIFLFMAGVMGVMDTEVHTDGVLVTFGFFRWIKYRFSFAEIVSFEARTYKPIAEFGGWGIKGFDSTRALNTKGNKGVELTLKSSNSIKRTVMIGSQRAEELRAAIESARRGSQ